jgi:hypothetical protein
MLTNAKYELGYKLEAMIEPVPKSFSRNLTHRNKLLDDTLLHVYEYGPCLQQSIL